MRGSYIGTHIAEPSGLNSALGWRDASDFLRMSPSARIDQAVPWHHSPLWPSGHCASVRLAQTCRSLRRPSADAGLQPLASPRDACQSCRLHHLCKSLDGDAQWHCYCQEYQAQQERDYTLPPQAQRLLAQVCRGLSQDDTSGSDEEHAGYQECKRKPRSHLLFPFPSLDCSCSENLTSASCRGRNCHCCFMHGGRRRSSIRPRTVCLFSVQYQSGIVTQVAGSRAIQA